MHKPVKARGFTILELVIALALVGFLTAVAVPRALKTSPSNEVDRAARQLTRDLETARMRAMATKRIVRVSFHQANGFYAAFIDQTVARTGEISETVEEARGARLLTRGSLGGVPGVELPEGVKFGRGAASVDPLGNSIQDPIALTDDQVEFSPRGTAYPIPSSGVIVLTHGDDASAVAAVTISGSGAFRSWRYRDGEWK